MLQGEGGFLLHSIGNRRRNMGKRYLRFKLALLLALPALAVGSPLAVHAQEAGGLKAEIVSVSIPVHRRPVVTFKIADSKGQALELADLDKDSLRFTIATITGGKNGETSLRNYILTRVAGKEYVYKGELRKPVLADSLAA